MPRGSGFRVEAVDPVAAHSGDHQDWKIREQERQACDVVAGVGDHHDVRIAEAWWPASMSLAMTARRAPSQFIKTVPDSEQPALQLGGLS